MRVLLTGSSGFIGKNFIENAPKDIQITGIYNKSDDIENFVKEKKLSNVKLYKCDFTRKKDVEHLFEKIGKEFKYCIYLSGNVNIPLSITDPIEDLSNNVSALINFLHSCKKINRIIYMSSAAVYDGNRGIVTTKTKLNPVIPYCISKLACEQYIRFFSYSGKIESYVILRFGGAYGKYSKKFIAKLIDDILLKGKRVVEVYGDGANIVNFMYVKDAINALIKCLYSKKKEITCNLGQENMTVTELVKGIANIFGKDIEIRYTPIRKDQKYIRFRVDVDFNKIFNFKPDYSFKEGIKEFGQIMKNGG